MVEYLKHFKQYLKHLFLIDFCSFILNVEGYPVPLPSPNLRAAVWILCLRLADGSYDPVGTIFAFTCAAIMNLLLTANHNLTEKVVNLKTGVGKYNYIPGAEWFIIKSMDRVHDGTVTYSQPIIPVERIPGGDKTFDWSLMRRSDGLVFDGQNATISLCPLNGLPDLDVTETWEAKVYYIPVTFFQDIEDHMQNSLSVEVTGYAKLATLTAHHLKMPGGQQKGASGGPVVDRLGRAIGMHLESWSSVRIKEIKGNMSDVEKDSAYNGSFTSIAENYGGFTIALVPAKIPALMALIVRCGGF